VFNFLFTQTTNNERRRWVLSPDRTHYQAGLPTREIKAKASWHRMSDCAKKIFEFSATNYYSENAPALVSIAEYNLI
jgi:hypothetical protein